MGLVDIIGGVCELLDLVDDIITYKDSKKSSTNNKYYTTDKDREYHNIENEPHIVKACWILKWMKISAISLMIFGWICIGLMSENLFLALFPLIYAGYVLTFYKDLIYVCNNKFDFMIFNLGDILSTPKVKNIMYLTILFLALLSIVISVSMFIIIAM